MVTFSAIVCTVIVFYCLRRFVVGLFTSLSVLLCMVVLHIWFLLGRSPILKHDAWIGLLWQGPWFMTSIPSSSGFRHDCTCINHWLAI